MEPKAKKRGCLFYGLVVIAVIMGISFIGNFMDAMRNGNSSESRTTNSRSEQQAQPEPPKPVTPDLELLSARTEREHGFIKVIGEVKNNSDKKIDNLMVSVSFYTSAGDLVKTDDAMIDYNPIMPGQKSPFQTIGTDNPAIERYVISFKVMFGGTVDFKDSRR